MPSHITLTDLAEIHKISDGKLSKWRREGLDVFDARAVVAHIWNLRRKPPEWIEVFSKLTKGDDGGTHEALKKAKTAGEVQRLRLINERLAGESYPKAECNDVLAGLAAALNLGVQDLLGTLPSQLEGLPAAEVEVILSRAIFSLRETLADLSSTLWDRVYQSQSSNPALIPTPPKTT